MRKSVKKKAKQVTWKMVEEFYKNHFNVSPELLDLVYSYPVLESYAKGIGVYSIMELTELDKDEIIKILTKYYGTWVFVEDLIFSPFDIFEISGTKELFFIMLERSQEDENDSKLNEYLYHICVKFKHFKERIKDYERKN